MKDTTKQKIVPSQKEGMETGAKHKIESENRVEAVALFKIAKERLMNINDWAAYCSVPLATTRLTDNKGNKVTREPKVGDYIRIDLVGPGPKAGDGYDWVRIEEIKDNSDSNAEEETFAFRVRPAANPASEDNDTSHFYTSDATSTFLIERKGNIVTASEDGKNEKPNVETEKGIDKVRNAVIAAGGMMGLSVAQWKILMKGILTSKM